MFGFGYYEGYRNTSGNTHEHRRRSPTRSAPATSAATAIRDPLTGLPFPGNVIPADRIDPSALQLLDEFVPRANSGGNRYIASPGRDRRPRPGRRCASTTS